MLLATLLVTGCGEDSRVDSAVAPDVKAVEVRDADGEMVMRHEFIVDGPSQETIMTAQAAGLDAVWGTPDDVFTARAVCSYTAGVALDARLLQTDFFSVEQLAGVSPAACLLRRPFAGTVDVVLTGGMLSPEGLAIFSGIGSSPTGQALINALGGYLGMVAATRSFSFMSAEGGIRLCDPDCAKLSDRQYIPAAPLPADTSCNVDCTGIDNTVYNPYAGLNVTEPTAGYWQHAIYAGFQYVPSYASDGRLLRLSYSSDLQSPEENADGYQSFQFSRWGSLSSIDSFRAKGQDLRLYTVDDVLDQYLLLHKTADGFQRVRYVGAGQDGVWKTGDDVIGSVVTQHEQNGRPLQLDVCSAAGTDGVWQTHDDVCHTLTLIY